jgi:hypothetical protein
VSAQNRRQWDESWNGNDRRGGGQRGGGGGGRQYYGAF